MEKFREFAKAAVDKAGIKYKVFAVVDHDLDRIWLELDGIDYTIRMWSITNEAIRYSIFRHDDNKTVEIVENQYYWEWGQKVSGRSEK